ncbi:MAG: nicotinamide-nucleotide amidohydrolase family protein [Cycloclasticus sp.]
MKNFDALKTIVAMNEEINERTSQLAKLLFERHTTLALAESCTGGWIAKVLTDVAGSSEWFLGGVVSYSNAAKHELLAVDEDSLEQFGAVSEQVAKQMVDGAQRVFSASLALSVTGVAGPTGGSAEKPLGLVWFGLKQAAKQAVLIQKVFKGDREQIRQQAVSFALQLLIESQSS